MWITSAALEAIRLAAQGKTKRQIKKQIKNTYHAKKRIN